MFLRYTGLIIFITIIALLTLGAVHPDPQRYSGIETMVFKPDTLPDELYKANVDFYLIEIDESNPTTNNSQDEIIRLGTDEDSTRYRAVFYADISALPDSAIIHRAKLRMLYNFTMAAGWAESDMRSIEAYRLLEYNDSSLTWNSRSVDSTFTWRSAGANDGIFREDGLWPGAGTWLFRSGTNQWKVAATGYSTIGGYYLAAGLDSIYDGSNPDASNFADRPQFTDMQFPMRCKIASSTYYLWYEFDITKAVEMWHTGQWANYGLLLKFPSSPASLTGDTSDDLFYNDEDTNRLFTFSSSMNSDLALRPQLEVSYIYGTAVEPSGSGGTTNSIGGAGGIN